MPTLTEVQNQLCAKYQLAPVASEDMVAVALATVGRMPIHGTRLVLEDGENVSWFIYCGEHTQAEDFYQPLHISHLPDYLPLVLPYLRLPPGANFIIDDQGYEDVWLADDNLDE